MCVCVAECTFLFVLYLLGQAPTSITDTSFDKWLGYWIKNKSILPWLLINMLSSNIEQNLLLFTTLLFKPRITWKQKKTNLWDICLIVLIVQTKLYTQAKIIPDVFKLKKWEHGCGNHVSSRGFDQYSCAGQPCALEIILEQLSIYSCWTFFTMASDIYWNEQQLRPRYSSL